MSAGAQGMAMVMQVRVLVSVADGEPHVEYVVLTTGGQSCGED